MLKIVNQNSVKRQLKISIVVPIRNEAGNIAELIKNIDAAMAPDFDFEIIAVDDASTDGSREIVAAIVLERPYCRLLHNQINAGQSAAVHSGVIEAKGDLICTLDGDGQNPPNELPKLLAPFFDTNKPKNLGLVAGQRVNRQDVFSKRFGSNLANRLRAFVLDDGTRDTGCGLKAFRRDAFLELPYFNHMHRFLPALFKRDGWEVTHVDVNHLPRQCGESNYSNLQRALVGIVDLIGVYWLFKRKKLTRAIEHKTT